MAMLPSESSGLTVDAVEWLPSGGATGLLRVRGTWAGEPDGRRPALPVLLAGTGERAARHISLPEPGPRGEGGAWRGAYILRAELVQPGGELSLELPDGSSVPVPMPAASAATTVRALPPEAESAERGGEVIERAVLAERRARRAEEAEKEQARVATEALKAVEVLELRGSELERRVEELAAQADAAPGLREELDRAREEAASAAEELAAVRDTAEQQRAALAAALDSASAQRELVREWSVRMRSSEIARTSDSVRLAVLESRRVATEADERELRLTLAERDAELEVLREQAGLAATTIEDAFGAAAAARAALLEAREEMAGLRVSLREAEAREAGLRRELTDARAALHIPPPASPAPDPASPLARHAGALAAAAQAPTEASRLRADLDAAAAALRARSPQVQAPSPPALRPRPLRQVLVALASEDPTTAARLVAALLPAHGAVLTGRLNYDLTIAELGTFAVTVSGGATRVRRLKAPRSRVAVDFRIVSSAPALAELLSGAGPEPSWFRGPVRLTGLRAGRARDTLRIIGSSSASLAAVTRAGARLQARDVLRALAYAIDPAWTRGHAFTVRFEVTGEGSWLLTVADGARVTVQERAAGGQAPAASVVLTRDGFDAILRDQPAGAEGRPRVSGDREVVEVLKGWTDAIRRV